MSVRTSTEVLGGRAGSTSQAEGDRQVCSASQSLPAPQCPHHLHPRAGWVCWLPEVLCNVSYRCFHSPQRRARSCAGWARGSPGDQEGWYTCVDGKVQCGTSSLLLPGCECGGFHLSLWVPDLGFGKSHVWENRKERSSFLGTAAPGLMLCHPKPWLGQRIQVTGLPPHS